jgi:hypothetical protein
LVVILAVLIFAGLLGSVAIRNSDIWQHLATGQKIATGNYKIGVDPYCHTTTNETWINPAWLFDLGVYWAYSLLNGTGVVVMRAGLLVLIAMLMMANKRHGSGWALPALGVVLALIAANARLPAFQPVYSSYLDLALLLLVLNCSTCNCRPWLRPLLVGLIQIHWVNHDGWFVLGPVTVALWALGTFLMPRGESANSGSVLIVLVVSIVACLVNPHLHRVFVWPDDLVPSFWPAEVRDNPFFRSYVANPFDGTYLQLAGPGPFAALYALIVVGILSFVVTIKQLNASRLLIWLALVAGACWRTRMVPFFAIGATPLVVMNFQDALARLTGEQIRIWRLFGSVAVLLIVAAAGFAAWPGWLGPRFNDPLRAARVNPILESDRGLQIICDQVRDWQWLTPNDRSFSPTVDAAHYLAWHAPNARSFIDSRWRLFGHVVADFLSARNVLNKLADGSPVQPKELSRILDQHQVNYVVLNGNERRDDVGAARALWTDPDNWPMWALAGRATIFGRGSSPHHRLDAGRLAFEPQAAAPLPAFPTTNFDELTFWDRYRQGIPSRQLELEQALSWLEFGNVAVALDARDHLAAQLWGFASSIGSGTANVLGLTPIHPLPFMQLVGSGLSSNRVFGHDDRVNNSSAGFVLALRNARLAQYKSPGDPIVYFSLSGAQQPLEMPATLRLLRTGTTWTQFQARLPIAAAQGRVYPDAAFAAANELFRWHLQGQHRDLAAAAARECLRWLPQAVGTIPDDKAREQAAQSYRKQLDELESDLRRRREVLELRFANQPMPVRFGAALQLQMPGEAIAEFRRAASEPNAKISLDDAARYIDVLVRTGQAEDARNLLMTTQFYPLAGVEPRLQPEFRRLHVWAAAAAGDIAHARLELPKLIHDLRNARSEGIKQANMVVAEIITGLNGETAPWVNIMTLAPSLAAAFGPLQSTVTQEADYEVWSGFLALEEGDTRAASRAFDDLLLPAANRQRTPAHDIAELYHRLLKRYEP